MNKITIDLPHSLNYHDVASSCDVIPAQGLSPSEAGKRLLKDGPNAIPSGQKAGMFSILVHQFSSLVVGLLAVAAAVAFYFGEWEEGIAIVGVLFLNAAIGFVTEVKAVRSIEAIRALGTRLARVLRGAIHAPFRQKALWLAMLY